MAFTTKQSERLYVEQLPKGALREYAREAQLAVLHNAMTHEAFKLARVRWNLSQDEIARRRNK